MSCVSAEDTLHTGEHDMIFYTYIWTKLIQIFIIISLIFNEFHTVKCRYLIAFIPWPKGLGDIAMSLASVRTSVPHPYTCPSETFYGVVLVDWNATYLFCMSCVSAEDTLHTGEHDMIFYTYIWTKLIQIFIIISLKIYSLVGNIKMIWWSILCNTFEIV